VEASGLAVRVAVTFEAVLLATLAAMPASVARTLACVADMCGGFLVNIAGVSLSVAAGAAGLAIAVCATGHVMIGMIGMMTSEL
jgi:hypothetical protein